MTTYAEKLRDPRWQKKRLKILDRDDWRCTNCRSVTNELHVDHRSYADTGNPWEVDDDELRTLCATCHTSHTGIVRGVTQMIRYQDPPVALALGRILAQCLPLDPDDLTLVAALVHSFRSADSREYVLTLLELLAEDFYDDSGKRRVPAPEAT